MAQNVILISESYIKEYTFIDNNVDYKLLKPIIMLAQKLHIETLTGSTLYADLMSQLIANNVTPHYQDLLDNFLQEALIWWSMAEAVFPLSYKFTNKNIVQKNSDNSQIVGKLDLNQLKADFVAKAEYYSERATKHLRGNPTWYPLYFQMGVNSIETIRPFGTNYMTGMFLGNTFPLGFRLPFSYIYDGKNGLCPAGYDPNAEY